jgi:hypothetical protein
MDLRNIPGRDEQEKTSQKPPTQTRRDGARYSSRDLSSGPPVRHEWEKTSQKPHAFADPVGVTPTESTGHSPFLTSPKIHAGHECHCAGRPMRRSRSAYLGSERRDSNLGERR